MVMIMMTMTMITTMMALTTTMTIKMMVLMTMLTIMIMMTWWWNDDDDSGNDDNDIQIKLISISHQITTNNIKINIQKHQENNHIQTQNGQKGRKASKAWICLSLAYDYYNDKNMHLTCDTVDDKDLTISSNNVWLIPPWVSWENC